MVDTIPISFDISTTNESAEIGVRVSIDQQVIYENSHVTEPYHFSHAILDDDSEHELNIEMFGKLPEHTAINEHNEIVNDAMLGINQISFDEIDVTKIVQERAEYHHDFNGTQIPVIDKFYNNIGCNGQVKLKFTTPIYMWLLEHM
jgi:hypothetical protein